MVVVGGSGGRDVWPFAKELGCDRLTNRSGWHVRNLMFSGINFEKIFPFNLSRNNAINVVDVRSGHIKFK